MKDSEAFQSVSESFIVKATLTDLLALQSKSYTRQKFIASRSINRHLKRTPKEAFLVMIQAVIFDIDGTLVDSVDFHAEAWQRTFRHFNHEIAFRDVRQQIGKGGDQLLPVFLSEKEIKERGEEVEEFRKNLYKREYLSRVKGFPQVRQLFERIKADGKRIVLASSAIEAELETYKKVADIEDLIEAATSADDAEKSKPHPDIFEVALAQLGNIKVDQAVVIGDTPYDAEAAGKIGLRTIGLLSGGFPEAQLRAAQCIAIYKDPAELLTNYAQSPLAK